MSRSLLLKADGSTAFPSWPEFLETGLARLQGPDADACGQAIAEGRYVDAAEIIKRALSISAWYRLLRLAFGLHYDGLLPQSLALPRAIWRCAQGLVVTTNYDNSLAWAVPGDRHRNLRTFGLEAPLDLTAILEADSEHPVLWHLHGRIDFPGSIIIAPDGYGLLYGDDPDVPKRYSQAIFALRHLIATRSLLFVGFSLSDAKVVAELQHIFQLFDESEHSHFLITSTADAPAIEGRITDAGLRNIELLEVADFGAPLTDAISAIADRGRVSNSTSKNSAPSAQRSPSSPLHLRRRCRSVLVGTREFRARVGPCIAEHRQQDHVSVLIETLASAKSKVERRIARAVLHELNGAIEMMVESTDPAGFTGVSRANLSIFHAIGLEKLNKLDEAVKVNNDVIADLGMPDELRLCASFNREVCMEKNNDVSVNFAPWLRDRSRRLSSGELVWPKAFNMELIACSRQARVFQYSDLLDEAISAEINEATTGFGKTILNWAHYSGTPLDSVTISEIWRVASHASANVRVAMLGDLWAVTNDETLSGAILDALDASAATSQQSATVLRILSQLH